MDSKICKPALVYFVISAIILCIGVLLKSSSFNLGVTTVQFCAIIICTLILMGLCAIAPNIAWIITAIFVLCTVSTIVSIIMNWISPSM